MNIWTKKSIDLANQQNYLDLLYKVYPMSVNLRRELSENIVAEITKNYNEKKSKELLKVLLKQSIFPIKDSYVAYLRKDETAIERNPNTINRIVGMLYEMGIPEILDKVTVPKETNRQIGPMFKNWINMGSLGCKITTSEKEFIESKENIVFNGSDEKMKNFANNYLGYERDKGLDLLAKFNNTYVLGEAKFLTDFGGHQNSQFNDAISTMKSKINTKNIKIKTIAILDGVLYIPSKNKMYKNICNNFNDDEVIISAILLRDYLYSI